VIEVAGERDYTVVKSVELACAVLAEIEVAAPDPHEIEQVSWRDDRPDVLYAELLEAIGVAHLGLRKAVVESHFVLVFALEGHADMAEAIELRSDLADLPKIDGAEVSFVSSKVIEQMRGKIQRASAHPLAARD
jgi:hypothetical protein